MISKHTPTYIDTPDFEEGAGLGGGCLRVKHRGLYWVYLHIRAVDIGRVANHVAEGDAGAPLHQRPREAACDPGEDDLRISHVVSRDAYQVGT